MIGADRYGNNGFRFITIDVERVPSLATKYNIDTGVRTKQLPTMVVIKNVMTHPTP
jgi:hypothetical protein